MPHSDTSLLKTESNMSRDSVIASYSPHLLGALERLPSPVNLPLLDEAFGWAMQVGGEKELDFTRDPEVSFNPRPARIPLILIKDASRFGTDLLAASILSTAPGSLLRTAPSPAQIIQLACKAQAAA